MQHAPRHGVGIRTVPAFARQIAPVVTEGGTRHNDHDLSSRISLRTVDAACGWGRHAGCRFKTVRTEGGSIRFRRCPPSAHGRRRARCPWCTGLPTPRTTRRAPSAGRSDRRSAHRDLRSDRRRFTSEVARMDSAAQVDGRLPAARLPSPAARDAGRRHQHPPDTPNQPGPPRRADGGAGGSPARWLSRPAVRLRSGFAPRGWPSPGPGAARSAHVSAAVGTPGQAPPASGATCPPPAARPGSTHRGMCATPQPKQ